MNNLWNKLKTFWDNFSPIIILIALLVLYFRLQEDVGNLFTSIDGKIVQQRLMESEKQLKMIDSLIDLKMDSIKTYEIKNNYYSEKKYYEYKTIDSINSLDSLIQYYWNTRTKL